MALFRRTETLRAPPPSPRRTRVTGNPSARTLCFPVYVQELAPASLADGRRTVTRLFGWQRAGGAGHTTCATAARPMANHYNELVVSVNQNRAAWAKSKGPPPAKSRVGAGSRAAAPWPCLLPFRCVGRRTSPATPPAGDVATKCRRWPRGFDHIPAPVSTRFDPSTAQRRRARRGPPAPPNVDIQPSLQRARQRMFSDTPALANNRPLLASSVAGNRSYYSSQANAGTSSQACGSQLSFQLNVAGGQFRRNSVGSAGGRLAEMPGLRKVAKHACSISPPSSAT